MRMYAYIRLFTQANDEDPAVAMRDGASSFWEDLIGHLAAMQKNESWLARRLGVPVQTLSSWKQRNQFRRACLPHLGELVHWDGLDEESAARLGVELIEGRVPAKAESHPTEEALRRINREYRIAEKVFRRYAGHTVRVLQTLGENCFYAFSAPTNTPVRVREHAGGPRDRRGPRQGPLQGDALPVYPAE